MNFIVQRYYQGHPLYSDANEYQPTNVYRASFGQIVKEDGSFVNYTMERRDTLIPEGTYNYSLYYSSSNKRMVILLHNVPGYTFIEHHIANFPHEVKGCVAHGKKIDVHGPALEQSKTAFNYFMGLINAAHPNAKAGEILGTIKYETLKQAE